MKKIFVLFIVCFCTLNGFAQDKEDEFMEEEQTGGFKKDHLFTGGSLQFSWSNYDFVVGVNPIFGYSFNKWVDVGTGVNFTYISQREAFVDQFGYVYSTGYKTHFTDIAPIVFAKFYPIKFLFLQAQFEQNFISAKYIDPDGVSLEKINYNVSSLLLGAGYCSGRQGVGDLFYFLSLSVDVLKNRNSPYVGQVSNGSVYLLPIFRAGLQIPLFQKKK